MKKLDNFVNRPDRIEVGPHQPIKLNQVLQFVVNLFDGRDFISHDPSKPPPYINSFGMNDSDGEIVDMDEVLRTYSPSLSDMD